MEDRNKLNLRLSSLSLRRNGSTSSNNNDQDPKELINILPSYQMYRSTIKKNLTPTTEDLRTAPPMYELTPLSSCNSSIHEDYFGSIADSLANSHANSLANSPVLAPQQPDDDIDADTLLENSHKLKRLSSTNKEISQSLSINVYLTECIGKIGEPYKIIDPLSLELKQGQYIYGFVKITNKTTKDIPFDSFSVQLEGTSVFGKHQKTLTEPPYHIDRFLTMFDFHASWNDAFLDRLVTDHNDPFGYTVLKDPIDNTEVQLNVHKVFKPNTSYKKFFTFKMPEKLLDSACNHSLIQHLQLPPTLGVSKHEVITSLRQKWKSRPAPDSKQHQHQEHDEGHKYKYASLTQDFAIADTSISYCVSARIIGRASGYSDLVGSTNALTKQNPDEFVVANEDYTYLRVIPVTKPLFELNRSMIHQEARLLYTNMLLKIQEAIELGKDILQTTPQEERTNSPSPPPPQLPDLQPTSSNVEMAKMQQSYYSKVNQREDQTGSASKRPSDLYEVFAPFKKKSVFGKTSKLIGLIAISTPRKEYKIDYIPHIKKSNKPINTKISIPIDISFIFAESQTSSASASTTLPDFKSVSAEVVGITIKSKRIPIPLVIHSEMLFENKNTNGDNFDVLIIRKFQKLSLELAKLLRDLGQSRLGVDKQLIRDMKCLSNLSSKYTNLKCKQISIDDGNGTDTHKNLASIGWIKEKVSHDQIKFSKKINVDLDLSDLSIKPAPNTTLGEFCLIPDFQTCLMARVYYLNLDFKLNNMEKIALKVPLIIQRS
ncbi:uncharacterized protein J8A68_002215 [[Candida] subhashii]|uniref:Bul1 N-terminal domain-containing protein n=1 Tax=[Candida] subhashii TaxID=561895 RepID=A0A8J5UPJ8_9ASCO|nr:uncharacterized protein J8A68_002215 [[Candida] subhashii]KAG7664246.1 hypothetical protein J8A68_002215 [[Candida] subhashii]